MKENNRREDTNTRNIEFKILLKQWKKINCTEKEFIVLEFIVSQETALRVLNPEGRGTR